MKARLDVTVIELGWIVEALEFFVLESKAGGSDIEELVDIENLRARLEARHLKAIGEPEEGY